ncbi:glycogen/starch synthase [Candidatus Woesearchaeota archaeon]|nr:glycogen/starch synthase [Candidatus Woesearchaeota archaeon]
MSNQDRFVFEASWEVCNKVGGIYTVVKSKAALLNEAYPNYFLIGPYFQDKAELELAEDTLPHGFQEVFDELKNEGIVCYFGRWQIKGNPKTVLIDFSGYWKNKDAIKKRLWDEYQIDSLFASGDFDEAAVWATAAGRFIERFIQKKQERGENNFKYVAHFHEWLAGFGLLYLKSSPVKIATVFTTHATMLGRTVAGMGRNLYEELESIHPDDEARALGVQPKHLTEKACVANVDVFTTVSEITGIEAEHLLGRKPDVLVLNGLDIGKLPTYEEAAYKHRLNREKIHNFLRYYFLPYYYFDIEDTLLLFIVGRYEYKNKGIDLVIESLAKLNEMMKKEGSKRSVICFFWIPRDVHGVRNDISINKSAYSTLRDFVDEHTPHIQENIVTNIIKSGSMKKLDMTAIGCDIFDDDFKKNIKKLEVNFAKKGNPPLSTHNIPNEFEDAIISNLINTGLDNKEDDPVKVIFYPIYLTGVDGLTDLAYYDAMNACHLGLFPSYYEPWGYTPLECGALGVPSLTSDLGGFGRFLLQKTTGTSGIFVLKRFKRPREDVINEFADVLHRFAKFNASERVQQKILAKELANLADWKELVKHYFEAHDLAIKKVFG